MSRVFLMVVCSLFSLSIIAQQSSPAGLPQQETEKESSYSLHTVVPVKVHSRQEALLRLIPLIAPEPMVHFEDQANESYINMNKKIDQRYFNNKFKVLSVDAPILFKLFT